jgi:GxxExxY protein
VGKNAEGDSGGMDETVREDPRVRSIDDVTNTIIGAAISVHRELGPGLLESTYELCLCKSLVRRGLCVERQVGFPLVFEDEPIECAYRVDILVDEQVVVELKAVTALLPVHFAQVMTYLKLTGCEVGLLINFNVYRLTDGLRRVIRSHQYEKRP